MQVNGAGTQLAPAGTAHIRHPCPGQHSTQENDGGAHFPHEMIGHVPAFEYPGIHGNDVLFPLYRTAQMLQYGNGSSYIGQVGTVMYHTLSLCQQGRRKYGKYAVFCAVDLHSSGKAFPALNQIGIHVIPPHRIQGILCGRRQI
ncbi:hypothetical protein SDC9_185859 [bioreactor metagenome]|uniref:Uncharacterized protein n=1 Tax=bioreactor metagenome TaxID=1076179 RepID=A0A645HH17_9ZZZZ